jgi:isocitrate dehydrogenase
MKADNVQEHKKIQQKHTFLVLLMVTLLTPVTGFMPSFNIALRLFFSLLLCLELPLAPAPHNSPTINFKEQ